MAKPRPLTWSRALGAYRQHLEAWRAAPPTLDGHLRELEHLRARVRPKRPDQVALTDLRGHQCGLFSGEGTRSGRPLAAATVAKISSILRAFFGFLRDEGLLATDPAARLERPRVPAASPGTC